MFDTSQLLAASGGDFYDHPIEQSLRFNDDDSAYLEWTPSVDRSANIWTVSFWFKRGNLSSSGWFPIWEADNGANSDSIGIYQDKLAFSYASATRTVTIPDYFRDPSAWYHLVISWDTNETGLTDTLKIWVNGVRKTDYSYYLTALVLDSDTFNFGRNVQNRIGARTSGTAQYFDGYLAEFNFIDGTALAATDFGETKSGVWIPKAYSGSYGTNGFYLDFDGTYYNDASGNGNNFTANNLAATDVVLDSPTNNFATLNPLVARYGASGGNTLDRDFYEGNLKVRTGGSAAYNQIGTSTFAFTSGKWYAEFYQNVIGGVNIIGFGNPENGDWQSNSWSCVRWSNQTGDVIYNVGTTDTNSTMSGSYTAGDIIGIALDMDTKHCEYFKNGTSMGSFDFGLGIHDGKAVAFICGNSSTTTDAYITANFGQDSSFAGNKTAQGNTDDNGYGDFYYAPPSGYLALCTANLEVPDAMNPALDNSPQDYFSALAYSGAAGAQTVTGVGFQPDLVWLKDRGATNNHFLFDSARTAGYALSSSLNFAELDRTAEWGDFETDGFSFIAASGSYNYSGGSHMSWNWKAGTSYTPTVTGGFSSPSASINTDAGFGIYKVTGSNSTSSFTHGLGTTPDLFIAKNLDNTYDWAVWSRAENSYNDILKLNTTDAKVTKSGIIVTLDDTEIEVNSYAETASNGDYIYYVFSNREGFSKFGSYTGNGSTDGTFVYLGFRPSFLLIKRTDGGTNNWVIYDKERDPYNYVDSRLYPNLSSAESGGGASYSYDFTSNGFKLRSVGSEHNGSGYTYIYMAFAENPFKYSTAR